MKGALDLNTHILTSLKNLFRAKCEVEFFHIFSSNTSKEKKWRRPAISVTQDQGDVV